jgi:hypothetical protein
MVTCKPRSACPPHGIHNVESMHPTLQITHRYCSALHDPPAGAALAAANGQTRLTFSRRPGILVLINDADWELEGEAAYALQAKDSILFVSTLHGG